ncbi:MAG: hypothetical protein K1X78_10930 [Verrucomicrobiaceae bacterium]|nr:hypothetical protein [Verrucomicrobiaceae bacterium]
MKTILNALLSVTALTLVAPAVANERAQLEQVVTSEALAISRTIIVTRSPFYIGLDAPPRATITVRVSEIMPGGELALRKTFSVTIRRDAGSGVDAWLQVKRLAVGSGYLVSVDANGVRTRLTTHIRDYYDGRATGKIAFEPLPNPVPPFPRIARSDSGDVVIEQIE